MSSKKSAKKELIKKSVRRVPAYKLALVKSTSPASQPSAKFSKSEFKQDLRKLLFLESVLLPEAQEFANSVRARLAHIPPTLFSLSAMVDTSNHRLIPIEAKSQPSKPLPPVRFPTVRLMEMLEDFAGVPFMTICAQSRMSDEVSMFLDMFVLFLEDEVNSLKARLSKELLAHELKVVYPW